MCYNLKNLYHPPQRQYHTYFDWDEKNANKFFSLFGSDFKDKISKKVEADEELTNSIIAFLELGSIRNKLAHLNFANYPLDKTADEIYNLYKNAKTFVDFLRFVLLDKDESPRNENNV